MGLLVLMTAIPSFDFGPFDYKKIDLLSEVKPSEDSEQLDDELDFDIASNPDLSELPPEEKVIKPDSSDESASPCKPGVTCIEDFSEGKKGLGTFLQALSEARDGKGTVRIAFYGDSFIEGDVFCGAVRDTLQTIFGGSGDGFVLITSRVTGFRNTIKHAFDDWRTYSIIGNVDSTTQVDLGPAGYCFKPGFENWVEYKVSKQRYLRDFALMKLYYKNPGKSTMYYTINDTISGASILKTSRNLREWKMENRDAKAIEFQFEDADSLEIYGASFEDTHGVYVDNFALRGNSGVALDNIPDKMFREFNQYRDYKLIFLQYGLNVIRDDSARYKWYAEKMIRVIGKLKKNFPKANIVLLSVSDRSTNKAGRYKTERSIPALRNTQRYIAQKTGIAFWDLYEAMGGEDSMVKFVSSRPALAAKDYTHLTFKGGKKLASQLVKSLLYELEKYEKEQTIQ